MTDIFRLRQGDRGRPITEIVARLVYDDLERDVRKVLRELAVVEREVEIKDADAHMSRYPARIGRSTTSSMAW